MSPDSPIELNDTGSDCEGLKSTYTLHLRDAKTRQWHSVPDDRDALAGRLQLYIYFTLLKSLITLEPPFDFGLLWRKLDINPDAKLPTKFLVQAQLVSDNEDFEPITLNDLVTSFYQLISDETMRVSPLLQLVYYLRLSNNWKGKGVDMGGKPLVVVAASGEHPPAGKYEVGQADMAQSEHPLDEIVSAKELPLPRSRQFICS
jgi:hypothetical protein